MSLPSLVNATRYYSFKDLAETKTVEDLVNLDRLFAVKQLISTFGKAFIMANEEEKC